MSIPLTLAQVTDPDCVVAFSPLVLDWPDPYREVSGAAAILRRLLYRWETVSGSLRDDRTVGLTTPLSSLRGARMSTRDLAVLQNEMESQGNDEDFVDGVTVELDLDVTGKLTITAEVQLVDGRIYTLELTLAADAGLALTAIGGLS